MNLKSVIISERVKAIKFTENVLKVKSISQLEGILKVNQ